MKLKFFIAGVAIVAGLASAVSCQDLTKDLTDLKSKVASLEATVQSLQAKIDAGAVITSVTPTNSGIVITLSNGNKYEITNGTNGKDGKDGKDGSVVTIGDNGNWFIDGQDTGLAAKGENGKDGKNGTPGSYYVPNAETGCFDLYTWDAEKGEYVVTPTEISFLAPGTITAVYDPESGTLVLFNVEGGEGELGVVTINTKAGLKSLAYVFDAQHDGFGVMDIYTVRGWYNRNNVVTARTSLFPSLVSYRVNPSNADISDLDFEAVNRYVTTKATGDVELFGIEVADQIDDQLFAYVSYLGNYNAASQAYLHYNVHFSNYIDPAAPAWMVAGQDESMLALKAIKDDEEIVSDFAWLYYQPLTNFEIINPVEYYKVVNAAYVPYYTIPAAAGVYTPPTLVMAEGSNNALSAEAVARMNPNPAVDAPNLRVKFDASIDLDEYVTCFSIEANAALEEIGKPATYKFAFPKTYLGTDGQTNQQSFVTFDPETNVLTVKPEFGRSAINRTPVVKVQALYNGDVLAESWIKLQISENTAELEDFEYIMDAQTIEYSQMFTYATNTTVAQIGGRDYKDIVLTWTEANTQILNNIVNASGKKGVSETEFETYYNVAGMAAVAPKNIFGVLDLGTGVSTLGYLPGGSAVNTALAGIRINDSFRVRDGETVSSYVTIKIPSNDNTLYPDVYVTIPYTMTHEHNWPAFNPDYLIVGLDVPTIQVKGRMGAGGNWEMVSALPEHFKDYLDKWNFVKRRNNNTVDVPFDQNHKDLEDALYTVWCPTENTFKTAGACPASHHAYAQNTMFNLAGTAGVIPATTTVNAGVAFNSTTVNAEISYIGNGGYIPNEFTAHLQLGQQPDNFGSYAGTAADPALNCLTNYDVKFVAPFEVQLADVVLVDSPNSRVELQNITPALIAADTTNYVTIKERATSGKLIWKSGKVTTAEVNEILATRTNYNIAVADIQFANPGIPGSTVVPYAIVFDSTTDSEASFGGKLTVGGTGSEIIWANDGAALTRDKVAKYKVTVWIKSGANAICEVSAVGKVIIKAN